MTRTPTTAQPTQATRPARPARSARPARPARRLLRAAGALGAAAALALTAAPAAQADPTHAIARTERVSVGLNHAQPDGASHSAGLSADGRYAVFTSAAGNLVPGDTNGKTDVFVRDLWTGRTERVDTGPGGAQADGDSYEATISGNGRYVAFGSWATDLAPGANRGLQDVYVHDRWTGETRLVSTGEKPGKPQSDRSSGTPSISWDGRYVAFQSNRTDLAPDTVTWFGGNIYVHDLWTGKNRLVSLGADGKEANNSSTSPAISADGGSVAFISKATNLTDPDQPGALPRSAAAQLAATAGQETDEQFTLDARNPRDPRDARDARGAQDSRDALPSTSTDQPQILKPRLYPLYVRNLRSDRTVLASPDEQGGYRGASSPSLSWDGRSVVYSGLVQHGSNWGDRHFEVYVRDLARGTETLASVGLPGTTTTESSSAGRLTVDGRWVYFDSAAQNLVPDSPKGGAYVFRRDLWTGRTERISLTDDDSPNTASAYAPYIDAFGTAVLFTRDDAPAPGDTTALPNVFLRRLPLF
ncbi:PD40 domain-containing protein [Streptomyces sp. FH025]|uniref:PD40 domain-containing protein n=1 Tax=Streptomyces sp. FH025 TaxID=2815937 RepID=UPI001A9F702C|nr:PD40 domain-containing protein [Streptomyces sp. FH025]MBO1419874.1 PD40 domain-containing protein [Streptomyces sp. FH025]